MLAYQLGAPRDNTCRCILCCPHRRQCTQQCVEAVDQADASVILRGSCLQENASFLSFPYVCPEPVLAKRSFLNVLKKRTKTTSSYLGNGRPLECPRLRWDLHTICVTTPAFPDCAIAGILSGQASLGKIEVLTQNPGRLLAVARTGICQQGSQCSSDRSTVASIFLHGRFCCLVRERHRAGMPPVHSAIAMPDSVRAMQCMHMADTHVAYAISILAKQHLNCRCLPV